jgi:hypothetical protein
MVKKHQRQWKQHLYGVLGKQRNVLLLLLSVDLMLIVLHLVHWGGMFAQDARYRVSEDRGYGEFFEYSKMLWIILALLAARIQSGRAIFGVWAALFGFLLLDDAFQVHEVLGTRVMQKFHYVSQMHVRAQDFGEITVYGILGMVFLVPVIVAYFRENPVDRRFSAPLFVLVAMLVGIAGVVDVIHGALDNHPIARPLALVEDGGEMLLVSAMCAYVLGAVPVARWFSLNDGTLAVPETVAMVEEPASSYPVLTPDLADQGSPA